MSRKHLLSTEQIEKFIQARLVENLSFRQCADRMNIPKSSGHRVWRNQVEPSPMFRARQAAAEQEQLKIAYDYLRGRGWTDEEIEKWKNHGPPAPLPVTPQSRSTNRSDILPLPPIPTAPGQKKGPTDDPRKSFKARSAPLWNQIPPDQRPKV